MSEHNGSENEPAAYGSKHITLADKVGLVLRYIRTAAASHNIHARLVPCPSAAEWDRLSVGHGAQLPSTTVMSLYANPEMHGAVRESGSSYREQFWIQALALTPAG